jgi:CSLREA domain-containing protein
MKTSSDLCTAHTATVTTLTALSTCLLLVFEPMIAFAQLSPLESEFRVNTTTYGGQGLPRGADADFTINGEFVCVWSDSGGYLVGLPSGGGGVGIQRFDATGVPLGTEFLVSSITGNDGVASTGVEVASADDGSFLVVWQNGTLPADDVVGRRFSSDGVPSTGEFSVVPDLIEPYLFVRMAADKDGAFVVAWPGLDPNEGGVMARRFDTGTSPLGTEFLVNSYTTGDQGGASNGTPSAIALDVHSDGDFIVVWSGQGAGDPDAGVFAQRFTDTGAPDGTEFRVNSYTTGGQGVYGGVTVKYRSDGDFVVAWGGHGSSSLYGVFGQRFSNSGAAEGTEFQISTEEYSVLLYGPVDLAVTGDNGFVVAWPGKGISDDYDVNLRHFDATGVPQGAPILAHPPTGASGPKQGNKQDLGIASDGANQFVVVWGGDAYDVTDSYRDVFARRFSRAPSVVTVTKTSDTKDGTCDADCSLREAIIEANSLAGTHEIDLAAGTYELTLAGFNEDASATGDLDVTDPLIITGAGAAVTIIDANGLDRVFDLHLAGPVIVRGVTLRDGFAPDDGGGIRINASNTTLTIEDSIITANTAQDFGGGLADPGSNTRLNVTRTSITGNTAVGADGGGLHISSTTAFIEQSTISGNSALWGGGIVANNFMVLSRSTVSGNTATSPGGEGGGLAVSGDAYVLNSTISGNTAGDRGGGITGPASLFNSTIVDNSSTNSAGGLYNGGAGDLANTVIARNTPDNCSESMVTGEFLNGANGHNVDDDGSCVLTGPGDQSDVADVGLGVLADNGGGTLTHAVLVGSPLIGTADSTTCGTITDIDFGDILTIDGAHDQRGLLRDASCDVGAVELGASCGGDNDADGVCNLDDNCPNQYNPDQRDSDGVGGGDLCDVCPSDGSNDCNVAESGAGVIDSAGGVVTSVDGLVEVTIPAGALAQPTSVSITGSDDPNFGVGGTGELPGSNVAVVKLEPEGVVFGTPVTLRFTWLDEETPGTPCAKGDGLDDEYGADETEFKVWRNGIAITSECLSATCEPGTVCTSVSCDECANEFMVDVTEFSEYVLRLPSAAECTPTPSCIGSTATQAKIDFNEQKLGKEKMKLQWKKLAEATTQMEFGDPVTGDTSVAICIYDDADVLLEQFSVDRAGQLCPDKACWKAKGTKGYGYKDKESSADGISKLGYKAGDSGKGNADAKGKNNSAKAQTALPQGVVAKLTGNIAPTIEMSTSDGFCVTATMNGVKKDTSTRYSAQLK